MKYIIVNKGRRRQLWWNNRSVYQDGKVTALFHLRYDKYIELKILPKSRYQVIIMTNKNQDGDVIYKGYLQDEALKVVKNAILK